jgi:hypothetical protein
MCIEKNDIKLPRPEEEIVVHTHTHTHTHKPRILSKQTTKNHTETNL